MLDLKLPVCNTCDLPSVIFALSIKAWTSNMRRNKFELFLHFFWEETLLHDGFFRDVDWRNHATKSYLLKQIRYSLVSLHGYLRAT